MRSRWTFETRILLAGLAVALPALIGLALALFASNQSPTNTALYLAVVILATWLLALKLRQRVVYPLYTLANLLAALREGDTSLRGTHARRDDAMGDVVWEINALTQTLRDQRLQVQETGALFAKVVVSIDIAIFTFNEHGKLTLVNPAGANLLGLDAAAMLGRGMDELGLPQLADGQTTAIVKHNFAGTVGRFELRSARFRESGKSHELLVVSDVSRALRAEEREAWQRLIRVLGHELNNSLAPIKSMAATLAALSTRNPPPEDWRDDLRSGLQVIGDRAESLTRFMIGYAALARLPPPQRRNVDIGALLQRAVKLEQRLPVQVIDAPSFSVAIDADQIEQAVINLVKNAVDSALPLGGDVRLRWQRDDAVALIEIEDDGTGLAATDNLFVPFFTTKTNGSGIGLALARQIAEAHGGTLTLENRSDARGCIARLILPVH